MPKYHRKPWSENRGKRILICSLTGKTWKAWKGRCYREGLELYSPETLKLWIQKNPWKIFPSLDIKTEKIKSSKKKNPTSRSGSPPVNTTKSSLPPSSEIDAAGS